MRTRCLSAADPPAHSARPGRADRPVSTRRNWRRRAHGADADFETLKEAVAAGEIDTVVVAFADMAGQLIGKRFHAEYFLDARARGDPRLQLSARQRHRYGAGARLRGGELGPRLWRFRAEARPRDAAAHPLARRDGARRWPTSSIIITTDVPHSPRAMLKRQIARLDRARDEGDLRLRARILSVRRDLRGAPRQGLPRSEDRRLLHRGLSRLPDHQGRAGDAGDPQRAARAPGFRSRTPRANGGRGRKRSTCATPTRWRWPTAM